MRRSLEGVAAVAGFFVAAVVLFLYLRNITPGRPVLSAESGGSLADWLAGIGTVAALFATVWSVRRSSSLSREMIAQVDEQLQMALRDERARVEEKLAEQASRVVGWLDYRRVDEHADDSRVQASFGSAVRVWESTVQGHLDELVRLGLRVSAAGGSLSADELSSLDAATRDEIAPSYERLQVLRDRYGENGPVDAGVLVVCVENRSDRPVYALECRLLPMVDQAGESLSLSTAPLLYEAPVLAPGMLVAARPLVTRGDRVEILSERDAAEALRSRGVALEFRDAASRTWRRSADGILSMA